MKYSFSCCLLAILSFPVWATNVSSPSSQEGKRGTFQYEQAQDQHQGNKVQQQEIRKDRKKRSLSKDIEKIEQEQQRHVAPD